MSTDDTASPEGDDHSASPESSRPDSPATSSRRQRLRSPLIALYRRLRSPLIALYRWDGWLKIGGIATAITAVAALFYTAKTLQSTQNQYGLSEQGQVTDRFSKAVEHLGSDKIDVRLGGIYSLERLARDSPKDQPTIIEILSAFVRTQAPADGPQCVMPKIVRLHNADIQWKYSGPLPKMEVDVQAAVTVLGRRDTHHDAGTLPDLSSSCLIQAQVTGGSLAGANFYRTKLGAALFDHTDLRCVILSVVDLPTAVFHESNLNRAYLFGIKANWASFERADMRGTELANADLRNASLAGANLSGAELRSAILTDTDKNGGLDNTNFSGVHYTADTKWPDNYKPPDSTDIDVSKYHWWSADCLRALG
jgi:hypothetical protein